MPSILTNRPVPEAPKHPQNIRLPPPCFTVGTVFFGRNALPKKLNHSLVSPQNTTPIQTIFVNMTCRKGYSSFQVHRPQKFFFLGRHAFKPRHRRILPIVLLDTSISGSMDSNTLVVARGLFLECLTIFLSALSDKIRFLPRPSLLWTCLFVMNFLFFPLTEDLGMFSCFDILSYPSPP